jgi:hypothetical protein
MLQSLMRRLQRSVGQLTLVFDPPPRTADELLERFRALGMARMSRVRLTRNRNVMVSFRDAELRVHRGFLDAPDDVLKAIVVFVEGRTRAERQRAKRRLLAYPIAADDLSPRLTSFIRSVNRFVSPWAENLDMIAAISASISASLTPVDGNLSAS